MCKLFSSNFASVYAGFAGFAQGWGVDNFGRAAECGGPSLRSRMTAKNEQRQQKKRVSPLRRQSTPPSVEMTHSWGSVRGRVVSASAEGFHQLVYGAVEVLVGAALLVDFADGVHDRGVVLAAELTADLGE